MQRIAIVVDDSRVARITLRKLLVAANFEVIEFGSGEEVLEYLASATTLPDIIFMDVMMNGMDGLTATRQLKQNPKLSAVPVVMCTGNDTEEDRQKALAVGAITALSKPPVAQALADIIADVNATPQREPEAVEVFDADAFMARVRADIDQHLQQQLPGVCRQVAEETSQRIIAEQVNAKIEAIQSQLAQQAEQGEADTATLDKAAIDQACKVAAEENVSRIAVDMIQEIVSQADLPKQVSDFLANEGEEWLTNQEEELGTQLNAQLESHIPRRLTEYLETHLAGQVSSLIPESSQPVEQAETLSLQDVELAVNSALHRHTDTVVQPMLASEMTKRLAEQDDANTGDDELQAMKQQLATLKAATIGLGLVVVGLLAVVVADLL